QLAKSNKKARISLAHIATSVPEFRVHGCRPMSSTRAPRRRCPRVTESLSPADAATLSCYQFREQMGSAILHVKYRFSISAAAIFIASGQNVVSLGCRGHFLSRVARRGGLGAESDAESGSQTNIKLPQEDSNLTQ